MKGVLIRCTTFNSILHTVPCSTWSSTRKWYCCWWPTVDSAHSQHTWTWYWNWQCFTLLWNSWRERQLLQLGDRWVCVCECTLLCSDRLLKWDWFNFREGCWQCWTMQKYFSEPSGMFCFCWWCYIDHKLSIPRDICAALPRSCPNQRPQLQHNQHSGNVDHLPEQYPLRSFHWRAVCCKNDQVCYCSWLEPQWEFPRSSWYVSVSIFPVNVMFKLCFRLGAKYHSSLSRLHMQLLFLGSH